MILYPLYEAFQKEMRLLSQKPKRFYALNPAAKNEFVF
jgi:hypothetical protein